MSTVSSLVKKRRCALICAVAVAGGLPSPAALAAVTGQVVAHSDGESNRIDFDTSGTSTTLVVQSVGVSVHPDTHAQVSIDTAAGTFSALVQSHYSDPGGDDDGALADIHHTESFVVSGADTGAVGYLRFSMNGTLWQNPAPLGGRPDAFVVLRSELTTADGRTLTLNYAWDACSVNQPCDAAGYATITDRRFELPVPLVDGSTYSYSYSLRMRTFADGMVDSSHTGRVYFDLPTGVSLLHPDSGLPTTFLSQQTFIPGVPEPEVVWMWALGLVAISRARKAMSPHEALG